MKAHSLPWVEPGLLKLHKVLPSQKSDKRFMLSWDRPQLASTCSAPVAARLRALRRPRVAMRRRKVSQPPRDAKLVGSEPTPQSATTMR